MVQSLSIFSAAVTIAFSGLVFAEAELDPIAPRLTGADAERGSKIFLQCRACHVAAEGQAHTVGPNLWGIVGRPVASMENFDYSASLKDIDGEWDFETLSRYLFDPRALAPETRMIFQGVKRAEDRADLIAYLRSLSDQPIAMPVVPTDHDVPTYGGLPVGEGREATYFTCRACHAVDQFTDRELSREGWDELLAEMVADHGMASPEPWAERLMLEYLATHFGKAPKDDYDWAGLPPGPGREDVYYSCNSCHSLKLVTQQGMSRSRWDDTLDWMMEEQGMSEFPDDQTKKLVLDYLAQHFGS